MFESKSVVLTVAGLSFFATLFLVVGLAPWTSHDLQTEKSVMDLAEEGITHEFVELAERFPERFNRHFPEGVTTATFAEALQLGHDVYVAEACWHCHTQQVRPLPSDLRRWGPVSRSSEYHNALQQPVLFGTRRVGPDLIREAARRSNDWHLAHFYHPTSVVPNSVMPAYRWFFDADGYPSKKGMAMIAYVQWLGSRLPEYPYWGAAGPGRSMNDDGAKAGTAMTRKSAGRIPGV